jgi:hypothetical protein
MNKKTLIWVKNVIKKGFPNCFVKEHLIPIIKKIKREEEVPILLSGYPKSGNTWFRFIVFNYFNIKNNNAVKTLTYKELNTLQSASLESGKIANKVNNFPDFYRTHYPFSKGFKRFLYIYIYRNPLDVLVSKYHWDKEREVPFFYVEQEFRKELHNIDYYVLYFLKEWIHHFKISTKKADVNICYEELIDNTYNEAYKAIKLVDKTVDVESFKKSIAISDFKSIKKMGRESNQTSGNSIGSAMEFNGEFTRKGGYGNYKNELSENTISKVRRQLKKHKILEQIVIP